jgi:acyl-CoA thioesterase I
MRKILFNPLLLVLFASLTAGLLGCNGKQNESASQQVSAGENAPRLAAESEEGSPTEEKRILFFGNSLTAGYGIDPAQAFPALIQEKIDSLDLPYQVVNAGLSGETTASGKNRIEWLLRRPVEILVLELGGNDGLRGIDPQETRRNLQAIIDLTKSRYPDVKIVMAGMEAPPNMGNTFTEEFRVLFRELAINNQTALIPFLLQGVGGDPQLNLPDGIHPTAEGHRIVAQNVWEVLRPLLDETGM